jgi:hypothetical protein
LKRFIGGLKDRQVVRVTDYWRKPFARLERRHGLSDLKKPDAEEMTEHCPFFSKRGAPRDARVTLNHMKDLLP